MYGDTSHQYETFEEVLKNNELRTTLKSLDGDLFAQMMDIEDIPWKHVFFQTIVDKLIY